MPELRRLEGFDKELANQIVGPDTLFGANVMDPSGKVHFIADSFPRSDFEPPAAWKDSRAAALRRDGGVEHGKNVSMVISYIEAYGLFHARDRLLSTLEPDASPIRHEAIGNLGRALEVMAKDALLTVTVGGHTPYEERYRAAVGFDPELVDTTDMKDQLAQALDRVGFGVTTSRDLRESMQAWEADRGYILPLLEEGQVLTDEQKADRKATFAAESASVRTELMGLLRQHFNGMDFNLPGYQPDLSDVNFDGLNLEVVSDTYFTGSMAYGGGINPDGTPALDTLYEYNSDDPISNPKKHDFTAHELIAHHVDLVMGDLRWRAGQTGIEGRMTTMCTPGVFLVEGFAQNMLKMLYGSEQGVIDALGEDQSVQFCLERLQDAAKHNASIWFQMMGMDAETVRQHLAVDCVLSDFFVTKLMKAWMSHPIVGPMYGPSYYHGHRVVAEAIEAHGNDEVLKACLHQYGYLDHLTLPKVLRQVA